MDYEQYVTLIRSQGTTGGCPGYTALHGIDILKEIEWPFTPDVSERFFGYIHNCTIQYGYCTGTHPDDPRVRLHLFNILKDPSRDHPQLGILANWGSCPETSCPTSYNQWLCPFDATPPTDAMFAEALNYRLALRGSGNYPLEAMGEKAVAPSVAFTKMWLAQHGPLFANGLLNDCEHVVLLIGYSDYDKTFKILNNTSINPAIILMSYSDYDQVYHDCQTWYYPPRSFDIRWFANEQTPLVHPYTARITVSHPEGRRYVTVKVGVAGRPPLLVWDQNNRLRSEGPSYSECPGLFPLQALYYDFYNVLRIDVPLPSYAGEYFPPMCRDHWYVEVTDASPGSDVAVLEEFTIARRYYADDGTQVVDVYDLDVNKATPDGGTMTVSFTGSIDFTRLVADSVNGWKEVAVPDTWVDFNYPGAPLPELGTVDYPFNTLAEGLNAVGYGNTLNIRSGSTLETPFIGMAVTLKAHGGHVTVGR